MQPIDDVAENIMNDQRPAPDRNPTIKCEDERCDATTPATGADGWVLEADPEIPVLCPACAEATPEHRLTPADDRRERNRTLEEYA